MPSEPTMSLAGLNENVTGLTSSEAKHLLEKHGPNVLPEKPPPSDFAIFISQFKNPMVYILLIASGVTFFLKEYTDTSVILLAVFINTILGFIQESRAGKALEALKQLVHPHTKVLRDGKIVTVKVEELVPGDVVLLSQGDKIPADGSLVGINRFFVTEAILTGESVPIEKKVDDEVFMGTVVMSGKAEMVVKVTGAETEMGKIAQSIGGEQEVTPLGKQLKKFSKQLSILVLGLITFVFLIGLFLGESPVEIFKTSVALAVSAIPEGLLVGLTVVLAIGMQRILARKGLVRNLVSAETLGGVTTICADKTGTLTQGKMQVTDVEGDQDILPIQVTVANDLDDPVIVAAWEWGKEKVGEKNHLTERFKRIDSIPFDSENQYFASLHTWEDGNNVIFINGAPEVVVEKTNLGKEEKENIKRRIEEYSSKGRRVIGFGYKIVSHDLKELGKKEISDFHWVGMLAFSDPVRKDVKSALKHARDAGIKMVIITGDYAKTAVAILDDLDMKVSEENVFLGDTVEETNEEELGKMLAKSSDVFLFARTKPHQKLKIVKALKANGEVVAMMGDGVNDAPALSKADIGIVVEEASDVAKESADLVLLDSSFTTILSAIEEGRGIFDNIRKIILYLMSDAFEEILIVVASLLLRLPLPITAAQILWVNLVSDGFPNLALTIDPKVKGIMARRPRPTGEPLVTGWMIKLMSLVSVVGGIFAFGLFWYTYKTTGDIVFARSVAFATVGVNSLVYVFSIRTLKEPFWKESIFNNKWLLAAVFVGLIFQVAPFVVPWLSSAFEVVNIGWAWVGVFAASAGMFFTIEISKSIFRKRLH